MAEIDFTDMQLLPRHYQIELYEKARDRNIIAVLGTGQGKTLISVLLIKYMLAKERLNPKPWRKIAFLVKVVPLVAQQAQVIRNNSSVKVAELHGELNVDRWDLVKWREVIDGSEVFVMTAQVLLDALLHAYAHLTEFSLLIFDEAHHAIKKDAFNMIMKQFYYELEKEKRPKIFGMTASPCNSTKNVDQSISELESKMDSVVCSALDTLFNVIPTEWRAIYEPCPPYSKTSFLLEMESTFSEVTALKRIFNSVKHAMEVLGPWCAEMVWHAYIEEIKPKDMSDDMFMQYLDQTSDPWMKQLVLRVKGHAPSKPVLSTDEFSPKVMKLLQVLKQCSLTEDFRGILFVLQRSEAYVLYELIQRVEELDGLRMAPLIGHGAADDSHAFKMNHIQQMKTLKRFRNGNINLLIASRVAEEGLDIPVCNVVIRFNLFQTPVAYIQSRGRARAKNSHYIVFTELNNELELKRIKKIKEFEQGLIKWCRFLPDDRKLGASSAQDEGALATFDDPFFQGITEFRHPVTGARFTLESAVSLLNEFCSKLPRDEFCVLKPTFRINEEGNRYTAEVHLPLNSPLRKAIGVSATSKKVAKASAALHACIELFQLEAFNEYLRPVVVSSDGKQKELDVEELDLEGVPKVKKMSGNDCKKARSFYISNVPKIWEQRLDPSTANRLWALPLNTRQFEVQGNQYLPLVVLQKAPWPSIPPIKLMGTTNTIYYQFNTESRLVFLSVEQMTLLEKFTVNICSIIAKRPCRKEQDLPYYVAPINHGAFTGIQDIQWNLVQDAGNTSWKEGDYPLKENLQDYVGRIIIHRANYKNHRVIKAIRSDLKPADVKEHKRSDLYYAEMNELEYDPQQPLLELAFLPTVEYSLERNPDSMKKAKDSTSLGFGEFCYISGITVPLYRSLLMLFHLLFWIERTLLMLELYVQLRIQLNFGTLLQVFTSSSSFLYFDYERLEVYGDTILKFISCSYVYLKHPLLHEGQLTMKTSQFITNQRLMIIAKERGLAGYLQNVKRRRKGWKPPGVFVDGKDDRKPGSFITDKQLADVVEALLAAAYLDSGLDAAVSCMQRLGLPLECRTWKDLQMLLPSSHSLEPELLLLDMESLENTLGYHFNHVSLLLEAVTHASVSTTESVACYQRLEFLGDAVLDFLVVHYLYDRYPDATPGQLTLLKHACVNNTLLAILCVHLRLNAHLMHHSASLLSAITTFTEEALLLLEQGDLHQGEDVWVELKAPKALADLLESLLGAVLVDSGYQLDVCIDLFKRICEPFFEKYVTLDTLKKFPIQEMMMLIQRSHCSHFFFKYTKPGLEYEFSYTMHGQILGQARDLNKKNAQLLASEMALSKIQEDDALIFKLCSCIC